MLAMVKYWPYSFQKHEASISSLMVNSWDPGFIKFLNCSPPHVSPRGFTNPQPPALSVSTHPVFKTCYLWGRETHFNGRSGEVGIWDTTILWNAVNWMILSGSILKGDIPLDLSRLCTLYKPVGRLRLTLQQWVLSALITVLSARLPLATVVSFHSSTVQHSLWGIPMK
jgi:hypothetical protein